MNNRITTDEARAFDAQSQIVVDLIRENLADHHIDDITLLGSTLAGRRKLVVELDILVDERIAAMIADPPQDALDGACVNPEHVHEPFEVVIDGVAMRCPVHPNRTWISPSGADDRVERGL